MIVAIILMLLAVTSGSLFVAEGQAKGTASLTIANEATCALAPWLQECKELEEKKAREEATSDLQNVFIAAATDADNVERDAYTYSYAKGETISTGVINDDAAIKTGSAVTVVPYGTNRLFVAYARKSQSNTNDEGYYYSAYTVNQDGSISPSGNGVIDDRCDMQSEPAMDAAAFDSNSDGTIDGILVGLTCNGDGYDNSDQNDNNDEYTFYRYVIQEDGSLTRQDAGSDRVPSFVAENAAQQHIYIKPSITMTAFSSAGGAPNKVFIAYAREADGGGKPIGSPGDYYAYRIYDPSNPPPATANGWQAGWRNLHTGKTNDQAAGSKPCSLGSGSTIDSALYTDNAANSVIVAYACISDNNKDGGNDNYEYRIYSSGAENIQGVKPLSDARQIETSLDFTAAPEDRANRVHTIAVARIGHRKSFVVYTETISNRNGNGPGRYKYRVIDNGVLTPEGDAPDLHGGDCHIWDPNEDLSGAGPKKQRGGASVSLSYDVQGNKVVAIYSCDSDGKGSQDSYSYAIYNVATNVIEKRGYAITPAQLDNGPSVASVYVPGGG